MQVLDRAAAPWAPRLCQVERAGLGPQRDRPCALPPLVPTYVRAYTLHVNVANGATEQVASEFLSQPFRVLGLVIDNSAAAGADLDVSVSADQDSPTTGSTGDATRRPVFATSTEGLTGQLVHNPGLNHRLLVGTIFRSLPCRLILTAKNGTAGAVHVVAVVTVEFLSEACCSDQDRASY